MSAEGMRFLDRAGIEQTMLSRAIPGVDDERFRPHVRSGGVVGFCSAYYERKNPSTIIDIVRAVPSEEFILVGRGWDSSPWATTLSSLPNLRCVEADYADYPMLYDEMDVFVSPSTLEGGPMPLLEAMMCNVVPIATRTGFAPDLIEHGVNGLLVPPFDSRLLAEAVIELLGNRERREAMGKRSRAMACELFSQDRVVRETMDVYVKAVNS